MNIFSIQILTFSKFRMNNIPIELCERENYEKTLKILLKEFGKRGSLQRLDNFINFKKQSNERNIEKIKPKSKLSFYVGTKLYKAFIIKT